MLNRIAMLVLLAAAGVRAADLPLDQIKTAAGLQD